MTPLKLTDSELDIILNAARPLEVSRRDEFLKAVAEALARLPHLGDGVVFQTCRDVQRKHWDAPLLDPGPPPRKYATR